MTNPMALSPGDEHTNERGDTARRMLNLLTRPDNMVVIVCCLAAAALTSAATAKGPGLTPDSVYYLSSGLNLASRGELIEFVGRRLTVFPPGLPTLIAIGTRLGLDPETAVRLICVVSAAAIVLLANLVGRRLPIDRRVLWVLTAIVTASPALLAVERMAWTEPTYIAVALVLLLVLMRVWDRRTASITDVLILAGLCWTAFSLRYAALQLIPATAIVLAFARRGRFRSSAQSVLTFGVAASAGPFLWMLRNHSIDGTFLGPRHPSHDDLPTVTHRVRSVVSEWVFPFGHDRLRSTAVLAVVLVAAVVGCTIALRRTGPRAWAAAISIVPLIVHVLVYFTYIVLAQLNSRFDPIDNRLLSPAYVPVALVGAVVITTSAASWSRRPRWATVVLGVAAAAYVCGVGSRGLAETRTARAHGVGFNQDAWRESPLANAVAAMPGLGLAITNDETPAYHLWAVARVQPTRWSGTLARLDAFATNVACADGTSVVAWFGDQLDRSAESGPSVTLTVLATYPDGVLYRAEASSSDGAEC